MSQKERFGTSIDIVLFLSSMDNEQTVMHFRDAFSFFIRLCNFDQHILIFFFSDLESLRKMSDKHINDITFDRVDWIIQQDIISMFKTVEIR